MKLKYKRIFSTNAQVRRLQELVHQAIEEEKLLSDKLAEENNEPWTFGERLSDRIAEFGGSWTFIISFILILFTWILLNSFMLRQRAFDPFPYILLNLVLSCIAAIQAPVIMMSQNRKEIRDRKQAENDYLINLKAEIEIRNLHQKVDMLLADQHQQILDLQMKQLELLEKVEKSLKK
ncbi:MAG: DUF1003 domain-containing protein [Runella sp.]